MEHLIRGFDALTLADLNSQLKARESGVKRFKKTLDDTAREAFDAEEKNLTKLGIKLKTLEKDYERTAGVLYDALNEANAESITEVERMPLSLIITGFADGTNSLKSYMGLVWACAVSDDLARNYALQYARLPDYLLSKLRVLVAEGRTEDGSPVVEQIAVASAMPAILPYEGTNMDNLSLAFIAETINNKKLLKGLAMAGKESEEELERVKAEQKRRERDWEKERRDRDSAYNNINAQYEAVKKELATLREEASKPVLEAEQRQAETTARIEQLENRIGELEAESAEYFNLADEEAGKAEVYAEQLISARREIAELRARLPAEKQTIEQKPYYIIDNPGVQRQIERRKLNYEMVCVILGPAFKLPTLSKENIRKNARGKWNGTENFDSTFEDAFDDLVKNGVILQNGGYKRNKAENIRDPHYRQLLDASIEARREAEG
jgi:hypothetical protein